MKGDEPFKLMTSLILSCRMDGWIFQKDKQRGSRGSRGYGLDRSSWEIKRTGEKVRMRLQGRRDPGCRGRWEMMEKQRFYEATRRAGLGEALQNRPRRFCCGSDSEQPRRSHTCAGSGGEFSVSA